MQCRAKQRACEKCEAHFGAQNGAFVLKNEGRYNVFLSVFVIIFGSRIIEIVIILLYFIKSH